MSIYINDCNKVKNIYINVNGKKEVNSCWVNKNGNPTKVFSNNNSNNIVNGVKIVTWANGTDEEITAMLDAYHAGKIDIYDYWNVGDERIVHLSTMEDLNEDINEQDVTLILVNKGGKILAETNEDCAFIVMQKEPFQVKLNNEKYGNWCDTYRRSWLNEIYRNSFPTSLKNIFKKFRHSTVKYEYNATYLGVTSSTVIAMYDFFSLPSEKEITGEITISSDQDVNTNNYHKQFDYDIRNLGNRFYTTTRENKKDSVEYLVGVSYMNSKYTIDTLLFYGIYEFHPIGCI